jgi:hypothetical protein
MEGDPQQPPLGRRVDRQVEHRALNRPVQHTLYLAGTLLQYQDVCHLGMVGRKEGHTCRLIQAGYYCPHGQVRVHHSRVYSLGTDTVLRVGTNEHHKA